MTTSMIFWSIVAILALIGLVVLFARDAKRASDDRSLSLRRMIVDQVADDIAANGPALADIYELNVPECRVETKRKPDYRYRSAITGKFVKASYAKRYPHRTVRSKVKS